MRSQLAGLLFILAPILTAQTSKFDNDIPASFNPPPLVKDYIKRVETVPMRDGVKLYTVIVVPNQASHAPILLTRTPYAAAARSSRVDSPRMIEELPLADEAFVKAGYIRVYISIGA